ERRARSAAAAPTTSTASAARSLWGKTSPCPERSSNARKSLPPEQLLQNLLFLGSPRLRLLAVPGPIFHAGLGNHVGKQVVRGHVEPAAHVIHRLAPERLRVFREQPIEKDRRGIRVRRLVDEHRGAEARADVSADVLEILQHVELDAAVQQLRHHAVARRDEDRILALRDPLDLPALIAIDDGRVLAQPLVIVGRLLRPEHLPDEAEDRHGRAGYHRIVDNDPALELRVEEIVYLLDIFALDLPAVIDD